MKTMRMGLATVALLAASAAGVEAQRFGVQASWADDADLGVGGRVEIDVPFAAQGVFARTFLIGSFDYFFIDCDECTYWEINANAAVPLVATGIDPYVGAGLNIARASVDLGALGDHSDTEFGVNLLGGLRFPIGTLSAYGEGRIELGGGEQFVLTFGILVGGT